MSNTIIIFCDQCTHLAIGHWLFAICYQSLATVYWLLAFGSRLLAGYLLLAIGYWLLSIGFWLLTVGFWLLIVVGDGLLAIGYLQLAVDNADQADMYWRLASGHLLLVKWQAPHGYCRMLVGYWLLVNAY